MDDGALVPDEYVIGAVKERIGDSNDFILDGFPRTLEQAKTCNIDFDKVLFLKVTDETVILRAIGRRTCSKCGGIFNVNTEAKPKQEGICDKCGGELITRDDDLNEAMPRKRIEVYNTETKPVLDFYMTKGIVVEINANRHLKEIYADIKKVLKN